MKLIFRLLLLVAGLAYGAMPLQGVAATALPVQEIGMTMAAGSDAARNHAAMVNRSDTPCPHGSLPADKEHAAHKAMAGGHCGTCLTLPPSLLAANAGQSVTATEAPGLAARLESIPAAPLERPPRFRG